jgi:hypothetical protein
MQPLRQKPDEWGDDGVGKGGRVANRAFDGPPIGDEDDRVQVGIPSEHRRDEGGDGTSDLGARRWVAGCPVDDRDNSPSLYPVLDQVGDQSTESVDRLRRSRPDSDDRGRPVDR